MGIQAQVPTIADEMARFTGVTTNNGEVIDPKTAIKSPNELNLSDDEVRAGAKVAGQEHDRTSKTGATTKTAPAVKAELTTEESDAALATAREGLSDGEELTPEEETEALAVALAAKQTKAAKQVTDPNQRVKRAQEGRRRAEARAARAESNLADLNRRLAAVEAGGNKAPLTGDKTSANDADKEPDPKTFEFGEVDPKYIRALARWETKQEIAANLKNQQTESLTAEQARAQEQFTERKAAFEEAGAEAFDDFQEVVLDTVNLPKSDPAAWPLSATVGELLLDSEFGPQIAYELASDPKEARKIAALTPAKQAAWFGQREAKISAEKAASGSQEQDDKTQAGRQEHRQAAPIVRESRAPRPVHRNNGAGGNRTVNSATNDFAAFEAMAQQPARR